MIKVADSGEKFVVFQLGETLEQIQHQMLLVALENNGGKKVRAARALGINVRTVRTWIRKYGIKYGKDD